MENTKKKVFDKKTVKVLTLSVLLLVVGLFACFGLHELSHYFTLLACNGTPAEVSIGGYIEPRYVPIVALSSIVVPLIISIATIWIKNFYFNIAALGFSLTNFINAFLGFAAFILIDDKTVKMTYDVPLAVIYSEHQTGTFLFVFFCIVACITCLTYTGHKVSKELDKYI